MSVDVTVPSSVTSSTLNTFTVCETFQLPSVKTNESVMVLMADSVVSKLLISRMTKSPMSGRALRTMVKLTVPELASVSVPPTISLSVNPATSLSALAIVIVWLATVVYKACELGLTEKVRLLFWVPSMKKSSMEESIMVCVLFQFEAVKVKLVKVELTSSEGLIPKSIITSLTGWASNTKVKLAVCVDASVKLPSTAERVNPGISLSATVVVTVCAARPVKAGSEAEFILAVMETVWRSSTKSSSTLVIVTV